MMNEKNYLKHLKAFRMLFASPTFVLIMNEENQMFFSFISSSNCKIDWAIPAKGRYWSKYLEKWFDLYQIDGSIMLYNYG